MWSRRKQHLTIGRIVTFHPTEGERYYLRLLLMNIRGPKSYKDLRTIDGKCYSTFREAAEKRGFLHSDNNLIEWMSEAVSYQMPYSLRRLFATLLVYCNPGNPKDLWKKFEDSMSEDFKIISTITKTDIEQLVLNHINEILLSMGHNISEFKDIFGNLAKTMGNNFPIASVDYTFRYIMEGFACNEEVKNMSHIDSSNHKTNDGLHPQHDF
ncbi:hypothetical protein H5410_026064 [Solanum commersonii]|uniref:Helitron helicase-like domain-containing protein n=1 Tax=Solanum commersonii TaxID=4109 RepID=A0A9J5YZR5_SOLCO|nr:hypothetical protein H5410_026064 [Solanum commersonii]